jgi:hypothetical protein
MVTQQPLIGLTHPIILIGSPSAVNVGSPRCSTTWRQPILAKTLETK